MTTPKTSAPDPRPDNVELLISMTDHRFQRLVHHPDSRRALFRHLSDSAHDINANKGIAVLLFRGHFMVYRSRTHYRYRADGARARRRNRHSRKRMSKPRFPALPTRLSNIFFGGFALATALHMQRLDRKIALWLISLSRGNMKIAVLAIFGVTAFIDVISNTATAAMMLPLALGYDGITSTVKKSAVTFVFVL